MRFEPRVFTLAKDAQHPEENQDAWRVDAGRAVAAVADGVASSIFARQWAEILAEAAVADTPDPLDLPALAHWLARRRAAWDEQIDVSRLAWFQKPKLREGAFSTLLWVRLLSGEEEKPDEPASCRLRGFAVGDSCLFLVRGRDVLRTFPVQTSKELEADPLALGSVDLNRDALLTFAALDEPCRAGDLLVLSTDAVADWALRRRESGDPPDWEQYWKMTEEAWRQEVAALRAQRQMRYDDATLVLLRVCRQAADVAEDSAAVTPTSEPAQVAASPDEPPLLAAFLEGVWQGRIKSLSGQFADRVSQRVSRGVRKFKKARESAEAAVRKYRERLRDDRRD